MRIMVTGGAGFIGSNVVDAYVAAGHDVTVVDDLTSGSRDNLNHRARWYATDIRSGDVDVIVERERPDVLSHHAAQINVRRSVDDPVNDASVNVLGSLNLLETARRHGVHRVIFASTGGAIYGEQDVFPADETHPCRPLSPYGAAKLAVESYLNYYRVAHGLETVVLRYANVYGPRQDPHGEAGVIAIFMHRALAGLPPTIFGDGEQTRDFVYVDDVVRANVAALQLPYDGSTLPIFNIGTGRESSINELWRILADVAKPDVRPYHEPAKTGEPRRSSLDAGRAKRILGWAADVSLANGVRRTWEWFTARGAGNQAA